jgi:TolB-like protein
MVSQQGREVSGTEDSIAPPMPLSALVIDRGQGILSNGRDTLVVGTRGATILSTLRDRLNEAVPKHVLMEAGWPGYIVEETSLLVQIASLRRALERLLGGTRWIVTVPRVGYRLLATPLASDRALPGRWEPPTIAVLPLSVLTSPPDGVVDAVALADTMTTVLALHGGLAVAPRSAARLYAESRIGTSGIAADLGVRYLVEGSWLARGAQVRVSLQLADAIQGRVIWSERFDMPADDAFAAQDGIAARLVEEVDVLLVRGEEARIGYSSARNLTAWTHYIRGLAHAYWPRRDLKWGHEMALAIAEWKLALDLDPDSAALQAALGAGYSVIASYGTFGAVEENVLLAVRHLQAALDIDPEHPIALAFMGLILSEQDRFAEGAELARRAIRLAPHAPVVCGVAGVALCAAGADDEAVTAVDRSIAASPFFPTILGVPVARAYRAGGKLAEAIRVLEDLDRDQPKFDCRELVLAYMQAGRQEDAINAATRLLMREPGFTVTGWLATQHRMDTEAIRRDAEALRIVGLPE